LELWLKTPELIVATVIVVIAVSSFVARLGARASLPVRRWTSSGVAVDPAGTASTVEAVAET
jgi:hypothetical protein